MAYVLTMDSAQLKKVFRKDLLHDNRDFDIIMISEHLKTSGKCKRNLVNASFLMPSTQAIGAFISNDAEGYKSIYAKELKDNQMFHAIAELVRHMVETGRPLILLCSASEAEYKYTKLLAKIFQKFFHIPYISYKKFLKRPEFEFDAKADLDKNYDKIMAVVEKYSAEYEKKKKAARKKCGYVIDNMDKDEMVNTISTTLQMSKKKVKGLSKSEMKEILIQIFDKKIEDNPVEYFRRKIC